MKRYVQTKKPQTHPQAASVARNAVQYGPLFLHATIDQTHPVGHKRTFAEHKHDFYHIVLYTEGYGEYSIEGSFHPAQPGSCVLIHPGQQHDFVSRWKRSVYSEITFAYQSAEGNPLCTSFEELLSIYTGLDISLIANIVLPMDQMYALRNLLMTATDHLNSADIFSEYHAQYDLAAIFNFLIRTAVSTEQKQFSKSRFELAKEYIEEHYVEQIRIDELTKLACVSRGYFFRQFKKQFGVSPQAYQQVIRIEAAKTLLKTTTLRCNEIAWRAGFNDVYFFHRIFKKHAGLTPVQYRKMPK
jgi:AraC-like DNA-binding protein